MRLKRYGVYMMCSRPWDGALYTGMSGDILERAVENAGLKAGGAKWALKYQARHVVYYEIWDDYEAARKREIQLKSWKREWKNKLIENANPAWSDLRWELEKKLASDRS